MKTIEVTHPGEILKEEFLDEMGIKPGTLARLIGVDRSGIQKIIRGDRTITADMSLRLGIFFGQSDGFWLRLQNDYDLRMARRSDFNAYKSTITPYQSLHTV